eukprot:GHVN01051545.1.p1 GENE.GHVN01051545.1~~GHVN01051545.1.p1  ORF type:complete len:146 (-),score=11.38 GHVN01051545.1:427-864(-)
MVGIVLVAMLFMEFTPKIPRIGRHVPGSLLAILGSIAIEFLIIRRVTHVSTPTIGDVSPFDSSTVLPLPFFLDRKYNMDNLRVKEHVMHMIQLSVELFVIGTLNVLMTVEVVDHLQGNESDCEQQVWSTGFGNLVSGFMGGLAGE